MLYRLRALPFLLVLLFGFSESGNAQTFGTRQDLLLGFDGSIFDLKAVDVDLDGDLDVIRLHEFWCTLYRQEGVGTNTFSATEELFRLESRTSSKGQLLELSKSPLLPT